MQSLRNLYGGINIPQALLFFVKTLVVSIEGDSFTRRKRPMEMPQK